MPAKLSTLQLSEQQKIALVSGLAVSYARNKWKKAKRIHARPWLLRKDKGTLSMLFNEFQEEDPRSFFNFLRMDVNNFEDLLERVRPYIQRQDTNMRECITPRERLALTLRFLATGESYMSLYMQTRISLASVSAIIPETCDAIYNSLKYEFLKAPSTLEEWRNVAKRFQEKLNFPNGIGALDGKHIEFRAPKDEGSVFRNYMGSDSIVFMALTDADYKFLCVDVGVNGRVSDGGVFRESDLHKALESGLLNIPGNKPLPGRNTPVPHVIVADDAFPLRSYLMKPFPFRGLSHDERIYNYRLCRARRIVENAFGIFSNRFRVFLTKIHLSPSKVQKLVLAACALHNYLLQKRDGHYLNAGSVDRERADGTIQPGSWRFGPHFGQKMAPQHGNRSTNDALRIRKEFQAYFNNEGAVPWQESHF